MLKSDKLMKAFFIVHQIPNRRVLLKLEFSIWFINSNNDKFVCLVVNYMMVS